MAWKKASRTSMLFQMPPARSGLMATCSLTSVDLTGKSMHAFSVSEYSDTLRLIILWTPVYQLFIFIPQASQFGLSWFSTTRNTTHRQSRRLLPSTPRVFSIICSKLSGPSSPRARPRQPMSTEWTGRNGRVLSSSFSHPKSSPLISEELESISSSAPEFMFSQTFKWPPIKLHELDSRDLPIPYYNHKSMSL